MEANKVAWVSTVHVPDDGNGEGFGIAHYTQDAEHLFRASGGLADYSSCAYGPSASCAIDTQKPFRVSFDFTPSSEPFGFDVTLTQEGRTASVSGVQYRIPPTKGAVESAEAANAALRAHLDAGMTLAVSYWSGTEKNDMAWLDSPCTSSEVEGWHCTDAWIEHPEWGWQCRSDDSTPAACAASFTISNVELASSPPSPPAPKPPPSPPPPSPPPPSPRSFESGVAVGFGSALSLIVLVAAAAAAAIRIRRQHDMGGHKDGGSPARRPRGFDDSAEANMSLRGASGGLDMEQDDELSAHAQEAGGEEDRFDDRAAGRAPKRGQRAESPLEFDYF